MKSARKSSKLTEIKLNAKGYKTVTCPLCKGTGIKQQGFTDYDGSGSFWVDSISCRCGFGTVKTKCSKEKKVSALRELTAIAFNNLKKEINS